MNFDNFFNYSMIPEVLLNVIKEYAEIEVMFASHGGNIDILWKKVRELAKTTSMSFRQATEYVLDVDSQIRQEPVGFLKGNWAND